MTSTSVRGVAYDRSYRKGRTPEAALAELHANRGIQFDPDVVHAITLVISATH